MRVRGCRALAFAGTPVLLPRFCLLGVRADRGGCEKASDTFVQCDRRLIWVAEQVRCERRALRSSAVKAAIEGLRQRKRLSGIVGRAGAEDDHQHVRSIPDDDLPE